MTIGRVAALLLDNPDLQGMSSFCYSFVLPGATQSYGSDRWKKMS